MRVNEIPLAVLMPATKYEGLGYPTHFLKSRGSVIRNIFFEYRTNQAPLFARRNDLYALLATNKAKPILNMHVSCSCSDTIYSKSKQKNRKKSHFLKFIISLLSAFSECKGVSRASSDRIIHLKKK